MERGAEVFELFPAGHQGSMPAVTRTMGCFSCMKQGWEQVMANLETGWETGLSGQNLGLNTLGVPTKVFIWVHVETA